MTAANITTRKSKSKARGLDLHGLDSSLILSYSEEEDARDMIANMIRENGDDSEDEEPGKVTAPKRTPAPPNIEGDSETPKPVGNTETDPLVAAILDKLDRKFDTLHRGLSEFRTSLEYSQTDIDDLKRENKALKNRITQLELEEKRNEVQMTTLEGRLDKLDTYTKRKNLIWRESKKHRTGGIIFNLYFFNLPSK